MRSTWREFAHANEVTKLDLPEAGARVAKQARSEVAQP
ncbi:hypothetical protein LEP1GSC050_0521 [Leptospira broomii serovar Hurstbridge str. 5399]|uniref:Uncharacterized protein n=1 Tax=Leptospira broomii serovar Hurstbridge str. 5399 TaxID=1049789 RepID=T0GI13_9LEPT|nr:hypothetical protein LEP1GSC050_0521 [Leptospira broomii serovar Hurstbridge str. 5399]